MPPRKISNKTISRKISKKALLNNLIEYVFETYCDDEQIAIFSQQYYEIEKRLEEKRKLKNDIMISKCHDKCNDKKYKITKEVRDFLEPLVDAEYFKSRYTHNIEEVIYDAMEQLQTKMLKKIINKTQGE